MTMPMIFSFTHVFSNCETSSKVRTVLIDGDPWFIASDVCSILNVDSTSVRKLDDDERGLHSVQTLGGEQKVTVINESGLYALVLRCRDAMTPGSVPHRFRKFVTSVVLPAVRKNEAPTPVALSRMEILTMALESERRAVAAEARLVEQKPMVEFVERYVEAPTGNKTFRQVCKLLGANEKRFKEFLIDRDVVYYLNGEMTPRSGHLDTGRFSVKAGVSNHSDHAYNHMTFTPKGVTWIAGEWGKHLVNLNQRGVQQRSVAAISHAHH
jgi:prophage antirepressor-like protein